MIYENTQFYFNAINCVNAATSKYWNSIYDQSSVEGKLWIDIAKYFGKNRFISRSGVWKTPWQTGVVAGFEMPAFDPKFQLSFDEITDSRAHDIQKIIQKTGRRIAVFYSGGIDSTVCLASLIRNLSDDELKNVDVCLSAESIIENPYFYEKHILNKLNVIDSGKIKYNHIEDSGNYAITSDQGDSIFGTELGTQMYHSYDFLLTKISSESQKNLKNLQYKISDPEIHYSKYKDLIIAYFGLDGRPNFGCQLYEKLVLNIQTSSVPIQSLHDFFWWYIFNIKYMECALRSTVYYYMGSNRKKSINETIINWFNHENYQQWSMNNNNNGQKIGGSTAATYKWAARKYIYHLDKNEWYLRHKSKLSSLKNIILRNDPNLARLNVFAMDQDYELHFITDTSVKQFVESKLFNFS